MSANCSPALASNSSGLLKLPAAKLSRTTGWRLDQSQPSPFWQASVRPGLSERDYSTTTTRRLVRLKPSGAGPFVNGRKSE